MLVNRSLFLLIIAGTLLPAMPIGAVEQIHLELGKIQGPGWSATGVSIDLRLQSQERAQLNLSAKEATWPHPIGRVRSPRISCSQLRIKTDHFECATGALRGANDLLGDIKGTINFKYRIDDGSIHFNLPELQVSAGMLSLQGRVADSGWRISLRGKALQLEKLLTLAKALDFDAGYSGSGLLDLDLQSSGSADVLGGIKASGSFSNVSFNNAEGTHAGEKLDVALTAEVRPEANGWNVGAKFTGKQGQLYIDPIFLEITDQPVEMNLAARWMPSLDAITVHSLLWQHPGAMDLAGNVQISLEPEPAVTDLDMRIQDADISGFYNTYVKPLLLGTMGGDLSMQGRAQGRVRYYGNSLQSVELELSSVSIEDQLQRIQVSGLQGTVDWATDQVQRHSSLGWDQASLFKVGIGSVRVPVSSKGSNFVLQEPVSIPVLDGELRIEEWHIEHPGLPEMQWTFDGLLTPISMKEFTAAMGWPTLAGKLSGLIPKVSYDQGKLKVGGVLLVRAFDGSITVRNLELDKPFGVVPRLKADVTVEDLDLKTFTRTFSFGRIEGRLGGYVNGLRMEQWLPVAFDAELKTPPGDKSRHRISQRALENISDVGGGGVSGALSRSFLGFFEDFPYRKLGISCRLENGVCQMAGVAPAENAGYYIVQGTVLPPRVDVIGFSDQVDWDTLVEQLVAVTTGEASATVQ